MHVFREAPEFVDLDNRKARSYNPVSADQLEFKHSTLLPEEIVRGKTVLDLGCGIGATGHWCLSKGARRYTGVEMQEGYADISRRLLEKYHSDSFTIHTTPLENFLKTSDERYDIVVAMGVLHASTNPQSVLDLMVERSDTLAIEELLPGIVKREPHFSGVVFSEHESMNLAKESSSLVGRGCRISPKGLVFLLEERGFLAGELVVKNDRYLVRAVRGGEILPPLAKKLISGVRDTLRSWL